MVLFHMTTQKTTKNIGIFLYIVWPKVYSKEVTCFGRITMFEQQPTLETFI